MCGSCVGVSCVGELCGELCGGMHTSHQMVQAYTHHCLQYSSTAPSLPLPLLPPPSPFLYCPLPPPSSTAPSLPLPLLPPPSPFLYCPLPPPSSTAPSLPLPLLPPPLPFFSCPLTLLLPVACGGTSQDDTDEGGISSDGGADSKRVVTDGDDTSAEGQEDDGDHTPSPSQSSEHSYIVHVCVHVCKWPCYVGCVHECAAIILIFLLVHIACHVHVTCLVFSHAL